MRSHLNGIDHCCVLIRDFDRARETFTGLGFTVSPLGRHGAEMGTGNHNVLLGEDYVELLGVLTPTDYNQDLQDALAVREGLAAVALRTDDAAAAAAEMRAAGVAMAPPQTVRRPVDLGDGTEADAVFTIARLTDVTGHLLLFYSQIRTPRHIWAPSSTKHPNTAWGIDHVGVVTDEPMSVASDVARVFDSEPQRIAHETVSVDTGGRPIVYLTRAALAARYPGADLTDVPAVGPAVLSVNVLDADIAVRHLRNSGVDFVTTADGIVVPPRAACGVLLVLRAASRPAGREESR